MESKTLPSGAVLDITLSDFETGHNLLKAVSREIEGIKVQGSMQDVELIKNLVMRTIYSEGINAALKPCFDRCMYNKKKITNALFEDEKTRGDYLIVVKEVLVANLTPFFSNLSSLFTDIAGQVAKGLVQK